YNIINMIWYILRRQTIRLFLKMKAVGKKLKVFRLNYRIFRKILNLPITIKYSLIKTVFIFHPSILSFLCRNSYIIRKNWAPAKIVNKTTPKILHVTCSFDLGGTQRQILNLCKNSDNRDVYHSTIEIFPEYNYLYRKGIKLERNRYVRGNYLFRFLGRWTLNIAYRSLQVVQIYKLVRDFQTLKPDVVVGWGHEVAMLTFVAATVVKVPKILFCIRTVNPSYGWTGIGPLLYKAHKKMIPYIDGVIVNSTLLQRDYAEWMNIPVNKVRVCANGIETHPLSPKERSISRKKIRNQYKIYEEAIIIVNIGRFSKEKGQIVMVKAFEKLINLWPEKKLYCLLCGDGPTQNEIKSYVKNNNVHNVIFTGRISDIHLYLSAVDIFVMPSDFEGMPNAMMEAMSYGLPCVSTNNSGVLDIARDNIEALYVDVGSVEQMFEKLSYLIENPNECKRLGLKSEKRLKEFSIQKMIDTFNRHLEEIL
ncbi:MAG: glycosyltransferase, partial [Candidatus Latescibacteria bacterium]|nr:glycosyltransferase [Candidatus Latescibacterota bacterium]